MKLIPKHQNGKPIKKQNWFTKATLNAAMADNPAIMTSAGWNIDSSTGEVKQDNKAFEAGSPEENLRNSLAVTSTFAPTHPLNAAFEMAPWIYRGGLYALGKAGNTAAKNRYIATSLNDAVKETTLPITEHVLSTGIQGQLLQTSVKPQSRTSLAFFERPGKIDLATKLGLTRHDRTNLNRFQREALEDLEQYVTSGQYRQHPTINIDTAEPSWVGYGHPSALRQLIEEGIPSTRGGWQWSRPNGGVYELSTDGKGNFGIGYNSYTMFDLSPEFGIRVGEASASSGRNGYSKIFLTAPKNEAIHFIAETPEEEIAKQALIETQPSRINKTIMKDFWSGVQQSLRPGSYLSGDEGALPKGADLIRQFKYFSKPAYKRDNAGNIIGSGRTTGEYLRNTLMKPDIWKSRYTGLSTDSYLALLKQASRKDSPYLLRYSPDGFTIFNNQSIDNKFISDLLEKTKTGEVSQEEFLKAFHDWVSPYGGMDAKIVNGKIIIPHPFLYKKKLGGKL